MSHFSDICTRLVHPQALQQALETLGFTVQAVAIAPEMTQAHLEAIALSYSNGYGDRRRAHVIARHPQLWQHRTAIGFRWDADTQAYILQCDAFELRHSDLREPWDLQGLQDSQVEQTLNHRIQMEHDRAYVRSQYPAEQYLITEQPLDNGIQLVIKPRASLLNLGVAV